jgi:hypothetical protein
MIKGVRDGKCSQVQAGRLAALRRLQHVLSSQRRCGPVTEGKRVFQEFDYVGFSLQVLRALPVVEICREQLVARNRRVQEIVGRGDVFDLHGKRAHTLVRFPECSNSPERS